MAWTTPITAAANQVFTAAQWNAGVRDNLAETAPGIAATNGYVIVTDGPNTVGARQVAMGTNNTAGTTTSTSYTSSLSGGGSGPSVTVYTGLTALTFMSMNIANSSTNSSAASVAVSGAASVSGADSRALIMDGMSGKDDRMGSSTFLTSGNGMAAGSNTFSIEYRVSGATGTFGKRRLIVMPLS